MLCCSGHISVTKALFSSFCLGVLMPVCFIFKAVLIRRSAMASCLACVCLVFGCVVYSAVL